MVGWHHQLNGHEFEQAPGDGEGQESLACPPAPLGPWASGFVGRVSVGFTPLIILFNRLLHPLRQRGAVGRGWKTGLRSAGPRWAGSPRAHPAQVGLTSLSHAPLQGCKPKTLPLFFCSLFSPAPLAHLISFTRSLTHP